MRRGGRIFYLGAGTSGRLGVLDASEIPPTFGMPPSLVVGLIAGGDRALRNPVEFAEGRRGARLGGVARAERVVARYGDRHRRIGYDALCGRRASPGPGARCSDGRITSNPGSPLAAEADIPIEMVVGPEFVTGSSPDEVGNRAEDDLQHDYDGDDDSSGPGAR